MMYALPSTNKFTVCYEYFGLCTSADVYPVESSGSLVFKCLVPFSAEVVEISNRQEGASSFWVELTEGQPTALAQLLGHAIENQAGAAHS